MAAGNTKPVAARIFPMSTRKSGSADVIGRALFKVGEVAQIWIETAPYCGGVHIDTADNGSVSPSGELAIDSITVQGTKVEVLLDASLAVAGDTYEVEFKIHPDSDQTILSGVVEVEIEAA
jgi:hypothetical protein